MWACQSSVSNVQYVLSEIRQRIPDLTFNELTVRHLETELKT